MHDDITQTYSTYPAATTPSIYWANPTVKKHSRLFRPVIVLIVFAVLVAILTIVPMPYVIDRPGPTFDVVGSQEVDGKPESMISITGVDPTTGRDVVLDPVHSKGEGYGELRMVTVSQYGGPGRRANLISVIGALFDKTATITEYDNIFPPDASKEQVDEISAAQMQNSESTSAVAALEELGWDVPATVTIMAVVQGSDADGKIQPGDILTAITTEDGTVHPVDSGSVPFALMRTVPVGSTLVLSIERDGEALDIPITSMQSPQVEDEGSKMGLSLQVDPEIPLNISIHLENVGGPSAGTMFALGIIDRLTPGDMTGGKSIAGTGSISFDGRVEPIGGIRQKMWGAKKDGAEWFLAPTSNCSEVLGHVPEGLSVASVSTLSEARHAVETIAEGAGDTLPTCTQ